MNNKATPQQIGGTITISSGEEIHIKPDSIRSNKSRKSSKEFVAEFKKAIDEGLFNKEDGQESATKSAE